MRLRALHVDEHMLLLRSTVNGRVACICRIGMLCWKDVTAGFYNLRLGGRESVMMPQTSPITPHFTHTL